MATVASYLVAAVTALHRHGLVMVAGELEVLASSHAFDGAATGGLLALGHEHPQEHDALALLARDLGPVVGIGGVGEILVLLVLLPDRLQQIVGADTTTIARYLALDSQLLGPSHDVLDH